MSVLNNIPNSISFSEYKRLNDNKVQIINVSELPSSNIEKYPILYKTINNNSVVLHEYTDDGWLSYGSDGLKIVELTEDEYNLLTDDEKLQDIFYKLTDVSDSSSVNYSRSVTKYIYGVCNTTYDNTTKIVTIENSSYKLMNGDIISITFNNNIKENSTMKINTNLEKPIYYKGASIQDNVIKSGDTATFVYDGKFNLISIIS